MNSPPSKRWIFTAALALCVVLGGIGGWLLGGKWSARHHPVRDDPPVLGQAPTYHGLTNQLNQKVDSEQFEGKVQVVTFLFPYCQTYCPLIAAHLVGFENLLYSLGLQDKVRLVAFDVDPAATGPKQMRAFLKQYDWNPENLHWQYLTGRPKTIRRVVTGGFHIAYRKVSENEQDSAQAQGPQQTPQPTVVNRLARKAQVGYDVTHNDGLIIVDPRGRIRKIYDQADMVSKQQLLRQVKRLLPGSGTSAHRVAGE